MAEILKPVVDIHLLSIEEECNKEREVIFLRNGGKLQLEDDTDDDVKSTTSDSEISSANNKLGLIDDMDDGDLSTDTDNDKYQGYQTYSPTVSTSAQIISNKPLQESLTTAVDVNIIPELTTEQKSDNDQSELSVKEQAELKIKDIEYVNSENIKDEQKKLEELSLATDNNLIKISEKKNKLIDNAIKGTNGDIKDLEKQAKAKFKNDLMFNTYFLSHKELKSILSNTDVANKFTLSNKEELWKDPFIRSSFEDDYGVDARSNFDEAYANTQERYGIASEENRKKAGVERALVVNGYTGNRRYDISMAGTDEEKTAISNMYDNLESQNLKIRAVEGFLGGQNIDSGVMTESIYATSYDAALELFKDELGAIRKLDKDAISQAHKDDEWFALDGNIDERNLTDVGKAYAHLYDMNQRQKLSLNVIPEYEINEDVFMASTLKRARQLELEGLGDWSSILPAMVVKTGMEMLNAGANAYEMAWGSITGEESGHVNWFKNFTKKYTPGQTYEARQEMWNGENVADGLTSGLIQLGLAYGLGAGFKGLGSLITKSKRTQGLMGQVGTRLALTVYGTGTAYDEFRDRGYSAREAGLFSMTAFAGMWWANGMSNWVSDGFTNKAAVNSFKAGIKEMMPIADKVIKESSKKATLGNLYNAFNKEGALGKLLNNAIVKKAGSLKTLKNGLSEGAEEMLEDAANEINNGISNLYNEFIDGHQQENASFALGSIAELKDYANQTAFSGVIGFGMGAVPGMGADIKRIAGHKAKDINKSLRPVYEDIVTLGQQDEFVTAIAAMRKDGELGSEILRADGSNSPVDRVSISQAEMNQSILLNDLYTTQITLGESKNINNKRFSPTNSNIDIALKAKKTYGELMEIYANNDIVYEDYKAIKDYGIKKFNKARSDKNLKTISENDFSELTKHNDYISDVNEGTAHRIAFMQKSVETDNIFGAKDNRQESLKDDKFDDLIYKYYKGVLSNADVYLNKKIDVLKAVEDGSSVKINGNAINDNTPLEDIPEFIEAYTELGTITIEDKTKLLKKTKEYLKTTSEYQALEIDLGNMAVGQIELGISKYIDEELSDLDFSSVELIEKEIARLSVEENVDGDTIPLSEDTKKELERLVNYKNVLEFSAKVDALTDEEKQELGTQVMTANEDGSGNVLDIRVGRFDVNEYIFNDILTDDNIFDVYASISGINGITEHIATGFDNVPLANVSDKYIPYAKKSQELYSKIKNVSTENKDELERSIRLDVGYLDKILKVRGDNGEVAQGDTSIGEEMSSYITNLLQLLPEVNSDDSKRKSLSEEQELLLVMQESQDELYSKTNALYMHMRFLDILSTNLGSMNSINKVINRSKQGTLLQVKMGDTIGAKILEKVHSQLWFKNVKYTLNTDFSSPEKLLTLKQNKEKLIKLNSKIRDNDISDEERVEMQHEIDILNTEFPNNIFDSDRKKWLESGEDTKTKWYNKYRKVRKVSLTNEEQLELESLNAKERILKAPTKELMEYLYTRFDNELNSIIKKASQLKLQLDKLDKNNLELIARLKDDTLDGRTRKAIEASLRENNKRKVVIVPKYNELTAEIEERSIALEALATKELDKLVQRQGEWEETMANPNLSEIERQIIMEKQPFLIFFKNIINDNNNTIRKKLTFYDDFFKQGGFSIKDKSVIANVLFDTLADEKSKTSRAGVGANYEGDVKSNFNTFVTRINELLKDKLEPLNCKK